MIAFEPNGLALEYQGDYGTASGDLDISDLVNNPVANGKCRVFGFRFEKKLADRVFGDFSSLDDDGSDSLLITHN